MPEHQLPEQPPAGAEDRQGHRAELHAAEEEARQEAEPGQQQEGEEQRDGGNRGGPAEIPGRRESPEEQPPRVSREVQHHGCHPGSGDVQ